MKILMLARRISPPGGAENSARTLQRRLSVDHEVVLCGYTLDDPSTAADVKSRRMLFTDRTPLPEEVERLGRYLEFPCRFRGVIRRVRPDLIFSQHELALVGAWANRHYDVPHVLFLHDQSMTPGFDSGGSRLGAIPNAAVSPLNRRLLQYIVGGSDLTIANSEYVRSRFDERWGTTSHVVYPFVDPERFDRDGEADGKGDAILHVNPSKHKGIDITLQVAERSPSEQFLVVGPTPTSREVRSRMERLHNVTYEGYVPQIVDAYRRAKLVLMPTRIAEPFGMVPIEAGINGIPTVSSGRGGLSESVGDSDLIVDSNDPSAYLHTIQQVLSAYDTYAERARENAEGKLASPQASRLGAILDAELDLDLGLSGS